MKTKALYYLFLALFAISLSSFAPKKSRKPEHTIDNFFAKRTLVFTSNKELEAITGKKFNFLERLALKKVRKIYSRELKKSRLLEECDIITMNNGEEINAIVLEVGTSEVKYKKCNNKNGPTYSALKSDIFMIKYANGSKDFFGKQSSSNSQTNTNDSQNINNVATEGMAIASISTSVLAIIMAFAVSGVLGLVLGLVGVVLGIVGADKIKKSNGKLKGSGLATAGVIIGSITLILSLLALISVL